MEETEAEAESEEKETVLIILTPIPSSFDSAEDSAFFFIFDRFRFRR